MQRAGASRTAAQRERIMTVVPIFHPAGFDRALARARMREDGIGALLLTSPENVFYTTGYTSLPSAGNPILYTLRNRLPYFAYVGEDGSTTLMCWGFSTEGVDFGADEIIGFNSFPAALEALQRLLRARVRGTLAVEDTCPRYVLEAIDNAGIARTRLASADATLDALRLIKSPAEIALVRRSTEIIETTASELFPLLRPGMSRSEIMLEARTRLLRNGANGISHLTFSFGDSNPEVEADEPLAPGRLITLDLGGILDGYCSDNRRYAHLGPIPPTLQARYDTMVAIVDGVGAALLPGSTYREVFARALQLFDQHGIELMARFTHVGHNIGLETEEEWLVDDPGLVVREGMVINIELYSHDEQGQQVGDEETYVIGPDGPERISLLPRVIHEIPA
jgi:Xaa-Pro aminopeptidase